MFGWLKKLHARIAPRTINKPVGQKRRPLAESLESRELMSATPYQVAYALSHSGEFYAGVVDDGYQSYLGRGADSSGRAYWASQMQAGMSRERFESSLIGSSEYIANKGGLGASWINGMYNDLLGRSADANGLQFWDDSLRRGARPQDIAFGFANSGERSSRQISDDYLTLLGRAASQGELAYWTGLHQRGVRHEDIIAAICGSDEYFNNSGHRSDFWLDDSFRDVLGRLPDSSARQYFLGELEGIRIENGEARVEGRITAIDLGQARVTIVTAGNQSVTVQANSSTKIERNDIHVPLSSLRVGDRGEARYSPSTNVATKIEGLG